MSYYVRNNDPAADTDDTAYRSRPDAERVAAMRANSYVSDRAPGAAEPAGVRVKRGDVVLYEHRSSYTMLGVGRRDSTDWRLATVDSADRAGQWTKLRTAEHGSIIRRDLDRGRTVGQILLIPSSAIDVERLRESGSWTDSWDSPDEARTDLKTFKR